jgi:DNA polymerase-3 subunit alpha
MSYIMLEDDTGAIELIAFQRALDTGGGYVFENAPLIIKGRISLRDEKDPQIVVDSIRPLSDISDIPVSAKEDADTNKKLYIRLPASDDPALKKIELILVMFPGNDKMVIYFEDTKKRIGTNCIIHDALVSELSDMLGPGNVVVK